VGFGELTMSSGARWWGALLLLCALAACSSSSASTQPRICDHGIEAAIYVHLEAIDWRLPLDIRGCIQKLPCTENHTDGHNPGGQPRFAFPFTLDDHHQRMIVPVTLLVTGPAGEIAEGSVRVPVLQDYVTDMTAHKSANCGGSGSIAVTRQGKLRVLPRGSN